MYSNFSAPEIMSFSVEREDFHLQKSNWRTFLVTYSQADLVKCTSRQSFGEAVEAAFNAGSGKVGVNYWACCKENHETAGQHYNVSIKLSRPKRWNPVKCALLKNMMQLLIFLSLQKTTMLHTDMFAKQVRMLLIMVANHPIQLYIFVAASKQIRVEHLKPFECFAYFPVCCHTLHLILIRLFQYEVKLFASH